MQTQHKLVGKTFADILLICDGRIRPQIMKKRGTVENKANDVKR